MMFRVMAYHFISQPLDRVTELNTQIATLEKTRDEVSQELATLHLIEMQAKVDFYTELTSDEFLVDQLLTQDRIDPELALALVSVESGYNPRAVGRNTNGSRDFGFFQLNSTTYSQYSASALLDPETNIDLGVRHLDWVLDWSGNDVELALWAYNAGPYRATNPGLLPVSTQIYAEKIQDKLDRIIQGRRLVVAQRKLDHYTPLGLY
jgi:hypothetical protein